MNREAGLRVFIDDEIFHWERRGGVTRYVCEVATILGRDFAVPTTLFAGWSPSETVPEIAASPGLTVIHRPRPPRLRIKGPARFLSGVWRRRVIRRLATAAAGTPIVYHPSLYSFDEAVRRRTQALVLTVHDMQLEIFGEQSTHARRYLPVKHRSIRCADWIFCISKNTEEDLHRLVPESRGKTQVVYNDTTLRPLASDEAWPADPCDESPYFLVVGTRKGYKNGRRIMEAFAAFVRRHPEYRLLVCGARPPGSDGELDFEGGEAIRPRVDWARPGDRQLAAAYGRAQALLYPSSYEGFGLPVVEAMRCGCPVVTTRLSSLPEVGGEAAWYLAEPTAAELDRAMEGLATDPGRREAMVAAGRLQAAKFDWKDSVGRMLDGYRQAIHRRATPST